MPGNPAVAERTVALLRDRGASSSTVVPGLSFAELAWTRVGVDPMARGARVVDARAIDTVELAGPMLIAQCDHALVLSDVKLTLLEHLDPDTPITVLQRLGLARRARRRRCRSPSSTATVEPDHLTSLFVDTGAVAVGRGARPAARCSPSGSATRAGARGTRSRRTAR